MEHNREYDYARDLALHIWATHYRTDAPEWEPCDTLIGILTQIDNMVTGLTRETTLTKVIKKIKKVKPTLLRWHEMD